MADVLDPSWSRWDLLMDHNMSDASYLDENSMAQCNAVSPTPTPYTTPQGHSVTSTTRTGLDSDDRQTRTNPSHPYGAHKQHTGLPHGSIPELERPQNNYLTPTSLDGQSPIWHTHATTSCINPGMLDVNPTQDYYNPLGCVDPSALTTQDPPVRLYPGVHQERARQQEAQRQQLEQQKQQKQQSLLEETISKVVKSSRVERSSSPCADQQDHQPQRGKRAKKPVEQMTADEKLLYTGKLSSGEKRKLRNKVSARDYRGKIKGELKDYDILKEVHSALRVEHDALRVQNSVFCNILQKLLEDDAVKDAVQDAVKTCVEALSHEPDLNVDGTLASLAPSSEPQSLLRQSPFAAGDPKLQPITTPNVPMLTEHKVNGTFGSPALNNFPNSCNGYETQRFGSMSHRQTPPAQVPGTSVGMDQQSPQSMPNCQNLPANTAQHQRYQQYQQQLYQPLIQANPAQHQRYQYPTAMPSLEQLPLPMFNPTGMSFQQQVPTAAFDESPPSGNNKPHGGGNAGHVQRQHPNLPMR